MKCFEEIFDPVMRPWHRSEAKRSIVAGRSRNMKLYFGDRRLRDAGLLRRSARHVAVAPFLFAYHITLSPLRQGAGSSHIPWISKAVLGLPAAVVGLSIFMVGVVWTGCAIVFISLLELFVLSPIEWAADTLAEANRKKEQAKSHKLPAFSSFSQWIVPKNLLSKFSQLFPW